MKAKYLLLMCFVVGSTYGQVGINTTLPMQSFHIDGKKDNPPGEKPNTTQEANDVVVDVNGNVGIGTITPTTKLDVKGGITLDKTLKINDIQQLTPNGVKSLFIDTNGTIGTAVLNKETSLAYFQNGGLVNSAASFTTSFNQGEEVVMPFSSSANVLKMHVGDIIEINPLGYLKIKQKGFYQLSLFVSAFINGGPVPKRTYTVTGSTSSTVEIDSPSDNTVYFRSTLQHSKDNGTTWSTIVGIRPIIVVNPGTFFYPQVFPSTIFELNTNDLIRVVYSRSRNNGGNLQGKDVVGISLNSNSDLGLNAYQFSISKL